MGKDLSGNIERPYFYGYLYAALGALATAGVIAIGYRIIRTLQS